jgi:C1A family cysteine protease
VLVQAGFFCDSAFENLTPSEVAGVQNAADPNGGGHAVYLYGYRTNSAGKFEYRLRNSWGIGWCDGGDCWVSEAWLLACWELFPVAVKMVAKGAA